MYNVREIAENIWWVGANDHRTHLFENIHPIPEGVSYNAYVLLAKGATCLFDTVDWSVARQFLDNLEHVLNGRPLDYIVINHVEPDHAATLGEVLLRYPDAQVLSTEKGFYFMTQFNFKVDHRITVKEGDTFKVGDHTLTFVEIPMVHWPEPMVTLDINTGVLFTADAFGSFKALDGKLFADEVNWDRDWLHEGRRYLTNIVGKYGPHVMKAIGKAAPLIENGTVKMFAPLHGLVWRRPEDIQYIVDKYVHWATYQPEETAVMIVYASMYGHTEEAAQLLASEIVKLGQTNVAVYDVSSMHMSYLIAEAFRVSHIVLASVTYNLGIYPPMESFIADMQALNLQKRTFGIIENGSWAPQSGPKMRAMIDEMKEMYYVDAEASFISALNATTAPDIKELAKAIVESMKKAQ